MRTSCVSFVTIAEDDGSDLVAPARLSYGTPSISILGIADCPVNKTKLVLRANLQPAMTNRIEFPTDFK